MAMVQKDNFIPFELDEKGHMTSYKNPYNNGLMLKIEDIVGAMLIFKTPLSRSDKRSLKRYRRELVKEVCYSCSRRWKCHDSSRYELESEEVLDANKYLMRKDHVYRWNMRYFGTMKTITRWVKKVVPCRVLLVKKKISSLVNLCR